MKRDIKLYLNDVLNSINKIESFSKGLTKEKLLIDDLHQSAIIRQFEIIGEATKNIPIIFREKYPNIPWRDIAGFRDVMIHSYFRVDLDKVWKVIRDELPELKKKIQEVLDKEREEEIENKNKEDKKAKSDNDKSR